MTLRTRILLLVCTLMAPASAYAQDLPPGPGADIITRSCQSCHGLDQVTSTQHDEAGWSSTVAEMVGNGAVLTDDEQTQAIKYLAAHFGPGGAAPAATTTTTTSTTTTSTTTTPAGAAPATAPAAAAPAAPPPMGAAPPTAPAQ
jgi:hypothetical protein